jgi:hypothetical protein
MAELYGSFHPSFPFSLLLVMSCRATLFLHGAGCKGKDGHGCQENNALNLDTFFLHNH